MQRLLFSESSSISKTRRKDGCVKYCITKYVYLKCDAFASNRSLKCSVLASENYPSWEECIKLALCFKCDKEEHVTYYQQEDSSEEKETRFERISQIPKNLAAKVWIKTEH